MEPKVEKNTSPMGGTDYEHPSYVMLGASRVTGKMRLVGSDLVHHHFISVRLVRATKTRSLSTDWWHGEISPIVEVYMSEAQWASFVSSMNIGSGVPCTLHRGPQAGATIVDYPPVKEKSRHELAKDELGRQAGVVSAELKAAIKALEQMVAEGNNSKKDLRERVANLKQACQHIDSNLTFQVEQHTEMMEKNVASAKAEVEGYIVGMAQAIGIESLRQQSPTLELEGKEDDAG